MTFPRKTKNRELRDTIYADASDIHGTGLFAKRFIDAGEYIGTFFGPKVKRNGPYVLWVGEDDAEGGLIGRSGRNLLRFLNHSTEGNAGFDGFDLYALVDIEPYSEITFDYNW
jgi:SET domain-containing protein